jgi:hypothetical protein
MHTFYGIFAFIVHRSKVDRSSFRKPGAIFFKMIVSDTQNTWWHVLKQSEIAHPFGYNNVNFNLTQFCIFSLAFDEGY